MKWVLDSSTLISLSRAGLLPLLDRLPEPWLLLDVVWHESVVAAEKAGHVDAVALRGTLAGMVRSAAPPGPTVDAQVLAATGAGATLVANDATLGRRSRNAGARWLRTADLVVLLAALGAIEGGEADSGIVALADAGRITPELAEAYRKDLA